MAEYKSNNRPGYSIKGLENILNNVIGFLFYYRLVWVILAIIALFFLELKTWSVSPQLEKIRNLAAVLTGGSVIIGIFYAILNYEHTQIKYRSDQKSSRDTLSFTTACDWHRPTMVENLKITKKLFDAHVHLIHENKAKDFFDILETDEEARSALVSIFNFFECIAVGLSHDILDNDFIKKYFSGVVKWYNNYYGFYIAYRRSVNNSPETWINFTDLARNWNK